MSNRSNGDAQGNQAAESPSLTADRPVSALCKQRKPPSPRNCRDFIRKQAADAMPDIVKTFVEEAKKGSVRHFASLTKVGGFDQRPSSSELPKRRGRSLGRQLLDEVERYEAKQAAERAAADAETSCEANSQIDNSRPQEKA